MGFSAKQLHALRRSLPEKHVRHRDHHGKELSYIEGWHAIAEANRIFGHDGWNRETLDSKCVFAREVRGSFIAVYTAKVRITVQIDNVTVVREGHGTSQGRADNPGDAHDTSLKGAETDATKRALATFGRPFGLGLYLGQRGTSKPPRQQPSITAAATTAITSPALAPATRSAAIAENSEPRVTPIVHPRRQRDRHHLRFVASQPCLICNRTPCDPHHLRFAQPRALGLKVSDEFTVPLCRAHHRELHHAGNEAAWWDDLEINVVEIAKGLWEQSHAATPLQRG